MLTRVILFPDRQYGSKVDYGTQDWPGTLHAQSGSPLATPLTITFTTTIQMRSIAQQVLLFASGDWKLET